MLFTNSIRFPNMFNLYSGSTELDSEYTSINRCIALILTTAKGELLGDPDFGCRLYELLFNIYDDTLNKNIKSEIVDSLSKYEKRIKVSESDIEIVQNIDNPNKYNITINYTVLNSPKHNSVTVIINNNN